MSSTLNPILAFLAGVLTILSPCVLPLVPIVLGSAAQRSRFGPLVLAAGLVTSFTGVGLLLASVGPAFGLDPEKVRAGGAVLLLLAGVVLLMPRLQAYITRLATPLADWANRRQSGVERFGLAGQFAIGALLGLVWSPCVGPTLGTATVLASQGQNIAQVALVMAAFGLGIASILLVIAVTARHLFARWRGRLMTAGSGSKRLLGGMLISVGLLIMTGSDRAFEATVVSASPDWLVELTTAY